MVDQRARRKLLLQCCAVLPNSLLGQVDKGSAGHEFGDVRTTTIVHGNQERFLLLVSACLDLSWIRPG